MPLKVRPTSSKQSVMLPDPEADASAILPAAAKSIAMACAFSSPIALATCKLVDSC
jgi:hypothetical protein